MTRGKPEHQSTKKRVTSISRRKLWSFRIIALVAVPLFFFGLLELGLRLAGFGYPTAFLLNSSNHGENTFVQNNQFGWRFFGSHLSRTPNPISISREKPPDTIRIFVFGESAAYGDPQPRFGLPRMLEAMLTLRHPEKHFEVINAAMTGINSHVILPLARDCAQAHGDVWVIYMGNNEVIGPFGGGTVFGSQTMPLPLIRASVAFKATRIGQAFNALRGATQKTMAGSAEWEGMRMFVNYKLAASDARIAAVYENFEKNLKDIIAAGQNSGAKIVLSTVAVNLQDCAPFASLHRLDLSESRSNEWQRFFEAGMRSQHGGDFRQAATDYDRAKRIDENFAELRFRRGQCALALNDASAAQKEFTAARDLDALRFRCDSRLDEIIRQQARDNVLLADSERMLGEASSNGIPGADFFYEHVHLTFQGNYILARAIAEKVENVLALPADVRWPQLDDCAQRLAHTPRDTQIALSDILGRLADVPFTFQANHDEQMRHLTEVARALPPANSVASLHQAQSAAEAALARWRDDAVLWEQLGEIRQIEGDYSGALDAVEHSLDRMPSSAECWLLCGTLLAQQEKYEEAVAAFKHVFALDPQAVWAGQNLSLCLEKLGRRDQAIAVLKRTLAIKPKYGTAWLTLGQLYEKSGRTNDAEQCYSAALTNRINQADDLAALARFCVSRRRFDLAATNFAAAVELAPSDPSLRLELGRVLSALGRHDEAAQQYRSAVELAPDQAQPHLQLGVELGRLQKHAAAEQEFRQALRFDPDSIDALLDLGIALYKQDKLEEALKEFEGVLQRSPGNPTALRYVQLLRNQTRPTVR